MYKFFVRQEQIDKDKIKIIGEDVNHIRNVLRLTKGENIQICNQDKQISYECEIMDIQKEFIEVLIKKQIEETVESNIKVHLFQGLPKFEKMEWIIEKTTELGVTQITPVEMKRCVVKLDEKTKQKKIQRWQKIAEVAAKQSKRDSIPKILEVINVKNVFQILENYDIVLVAYENEKQNLLKDELKKIQQVGGNIKIAIVIGPEGGIDEMEIQLFKEAKAKIITLGKRILRTETAPVAMIANVMYELEN